MVNTLARKRIIVGITGGIAAYKSADLVRRLRERDAEVRVVMTPAAQEFIGALTLQALSGQPVHVSLLDPAAESGMGHIELARWADRLLVAPATADFMAKLSYGLADDMLSTVCLASSAPIVVAPAMNQQMWAAAATQANCATLATRGIQLLGPAAGDQACGEVGPGRMLEPLELVSALAATFAPGTLSDVRVLVTAGPTREPLDPVRYISNRSSGRMGYAVARAAAEAGAAVTLVSGPVNLEPPDTVQRIPITTAEEMLHAVTGTLTQTDIFIAAAAVADYRAGVPASDKLKKDDAILALNLERTPDILATAARGPHAPFTVGFAAETRNLDVYARTKLREKSIDLIAANDVSRGDIGFDSEDNELHVLWADGELKLKRAPKERLARELVAVIAERYHAKQTAH